MCAGRWRSHGAAGELRGLQLQTPVENPDCSCKLEECVCVLCERRTCETTSSATSPERPSTTCAIGRGDQGHWMLEGCIVSQSEVIRAIVLKFSP